MLFSIPVANMKLAMTQSPRVCRFFSRAAAGFAAGTDSLAHKKENLGAKSRS
jgi:hypothetical protein